LAYNIQYKRSVEKDLSRLDKREARRVLDKIEKELSTHPDRYPILKGEFEGLRKMRMGDYRVIYAILGNDVLILRIGNRREVYR
jgi:addiction module RelE/StbE family toxin